MIFIFCTHNHNIVDTGHHYYITKAVPFFCSKKVPTCVECVSNRKWQDLHRTVIYTVNRECAGHTILYFLL